MRVFGFNSDVWRKLAGFEGKKSTLKEKSSIERISDIGKVVKQCLEESNTSDICGPSQNRIRNVRVIGVIHLEKYSGCLKCKTKLVPEEGDPDLGLCPKCKMVQCFETSHIITKPIDISNGD